MRRVFAAEYILQSSVLTSIADKPGLVSSNKLKDALVRPFFKPQATNNLIARDFVRVSDRFDVDYPAMAAAAEASTRGAGTVDEAYRAYNFVGHMPSSRCTRLGHTPQLP